MSGTTYFFLAMGIAAAVTAILCSAEVAAVVNVLLELKR